ncbi:TIGR00730 family Rossman fold protein [Companilactobacillus halodurans]|uniref:Cytokinin riboside 5'-monophosphate phosphoribohydrolase n=1 Tax=Companilactobacillus halodurans TaxID=2584183 RepID=A0A5P0ZS52_9LACO|nr:TIGR00730 family Rossman fold protein [Companilactobacillus halodurans]MQS76895.1 TIGR00730 family Rossman fold protein [Companilactobacillus halodurans]MQS98438.1 TIGR00730 family Rossman fold protein [Companilactobacillus halodurans]
MKNIAVYCGAAPGNNPAYQIGAEKLGHWMAENNYGLTYGGGKYGLMGVIADSVLENHGFVHGIITQELHDRKLMHPNLTKTDIVKTMSKRKQAMLDDSIANIALPGGPGTLEEISGAFSWTILGDSKNPCIFYNIDHYYDKLASFFDSMTQEGFMEAPTRKTLLFSDSLTEIGAFINSYTPPNLRIYRNK